MLLTSCLFVCLLVGWLIPVATSFPGCAVQTKAVPVPFFFVQFISKVARLGKTQVNPTYVKLLLPGISLNNIKFLEGLSVI